MYNNELNYGPQSGTNQIIKPKTLFSRSKIKSMYISPKDLNLENITNLFLTNLKLNIMYSIIIKLKYNYGSYAMLSKQEGLQLSNYNDIEAISKFYDNLQDNIQVFKSKYSVDRIELYQITYVTMSESNKLKLKNVDNLKLNKEFMSIKDEKFSFSSRLLPLSVNTNYYGELVTGRHFHKHLNNIKKENDTLPKNAINVNCLETMHLYKDSYLIISHKPENLKVKRDVYSYHTGKFKDRFEDFIINNTYFMRERGHIKMDIKNEAVVMTEAVKQLPTIKYRAKPYHQIANSNIGSFSFATYVNSEGTSVIYNIGYKTSTEKPIVYYLNENKNVGDIVLQCFNDMLNPKYDGFIFYTYNFGNNDSIEILKKLKQANIDLGKEHYITKSTYRDSTMLKLEIKKRRELSNRNQKTTGARKEPPFVKITIIDSHALLNVTLNDLCNSFDVNGHIDNFPHDFIKENTLNYIGDTPNIMYWKEINNDQYIINKSDTWSVKDKSYNYITSILTNLLSVMIKLNKYIFRTYDIQMTDSPTMSRLALNIYLKDYLNKSPIPLIKSNMFKDIRHAYYGGVTEIYKPHGKNLYFYDVNSLYPYSSLNSIPGKSCKYLESYDDKGLNLDKLFGFYYCDIKTDDNYLGLLPVRTTSGQLMPNGHWIGWYFTEELKLARDNGYQIKITKGYDFSKISNVFNKYVNDIYKIKSDSQNFEKTIAKSLLNNLFGRFGMNIDKSKTEVVNEDKLIELQSTRAFESVPRQITDTDYLISYYPEISQQTCESHGVEYTDVYMKSLDDKDMENNKEYMDVSLTTAAAITSYARIYMAKVKLDILSLGTNIYYTDTDSLVTDKPLPDHLTGKELGKFRLQYHVKEGYFLKSKSYCLLLDNDKIIAKNNGLFNTNMLLKDFSEMYMNNKPDSFKHNTIVNSDGYVVLKTEGNDLDLNGYNKRNKLYSEGKWIDTKPIIVNI